ncbi:hypothetical protein CG723_20170 [Streptomyces sp. CB01635]|nr:hypothetical protein CG723_20170 [Streptomyces sp. CB01635]
MSALSGALSFLALEMKSLGSSGGGGVVSANVGSAVAVSLGMSAVVGSWSAGLFEAEFLPLAETIANATAEPTATVASAPPPIISQRRRRARVSDASASAAQSGPCEPPLPPEPHWGPPCPKLMGRILDRRAGGAAARWGRGCAGSGRSCVCRVCASCVPGVTLVRRCLRRRAVYSGRRQGRPVRRIRRCRCPGPRFDP